MQHDRIIETLEDRLRDTNSYGLILSCQNYVTHGIYGECDLMALRGYYALLFEVKGIDKPKNRKKAYRQLNKDLGWVHDKYGELRTFKFYVYSNKDTISLEWVK